MMVGSPHDQEGEDGQTSRNMECEFDIECPIEQDQFKNDMQETIPEGFPRENNVDGKIIDLHTGMDFESLDDAFKSYSDYVYNRGFSVRKHRII
ncbi:hypothetical protein ACH5RR_015241 [Cinchona calisaya]|uniref:FAR1 domain-containing protein n=1 Tax=Cinchona calisaya TaxID=153742 RepID=A0ABD2ZW47_9GENT